MQVGCVSTPVGPDPSPDAAERKIEKVSPRPNVTSQTISKLRAPKNLERPQFGPYWVAERKIFKNYSVRQISSAEILALNFGGIKGRTACSI